MRRLGRIVRFILGPSLFRDRPADQTRLTAGPLAGSERIIKADSADEAQDAAREVRRRGNYSR